MKKLLSKPILLITMLMSGCSNNMGKNISSLSIHLPSLNLTIDPQKMEDAYSMMVVLQVYRGLFRYSPEGELKSDLAKSWEESADHKTYTIKIRDAKFSNGTLITSENVRATFARIFLFGASIGADIDYIDGSKLYRKSKKLSDLGINVIDMHTVRFRLERPSALFFKHLATVDCSILPLENPNEELFQDEKMTASGPYRVASRSLDLIKLIRWRSDLLDSANPPAEVSIFLPKNLDPEAIFQQGRTDSFDDDRLTNDFEEKIKNRGWKQYVTEIARERFVIMHPGRIKMLTRQYFASRVDPKKIISRLPVSFLTPSFGIIPTGISGELSEVDVFDYRKSIQNSPPPKNFSFTLTYLANDGLSLNIAKILQACWETESVKIRLDPVDHPTLLSRMFNKDFDLILGSKGVDYPDGYSVLTYFKSGYEGNYFHVDNHEIDADLENLITIFNPAERERGYKKIQIKILREFTLIPLFFGSPSSGYWSPRVKKVPSHPMGLHTLPLESVEMR